MCEMAIALPKSPNTDDREGIWDLWEQFLENYKAFKAGKMPLEDEDKYRLLSAPGPSQYYAFTGLFDFFKNEEQMVKEKPDILYTYDLVEEPTDLPMLELLKILCSSAYDATGKNIIMTSGSFWEQYPAIRAKFISYLEKLYNKGAKVKIFTQAEMSEKSIADIIEPVKKESRFGLKNRIPIHFLQVDKDYIQPEFPHTESSLFRLNMFLDLNKIEPDLKTEKTKEDLLAFFNSLIMGAL
jgi:hypothetical protein